MLHGDDTCRTRSRLGPGRAASFGVASAGLPLVVHGAGGIEALAWWLLLAGAFAAWSWRASCAASRRPVILGAGVAAAQLLVHATYTLAAAPTSGAAGAAHAHHVPPDAGAMVAMVVVHGLAIVVGASVLAALDRRALRAVGRAFELVLAVVRRFVDRRPAASSACSAARQDDALDARARRLRAAARGLARRGPPARVESPVTC